MTNLTDIEKLCVLSFDETYVSKIICYDKNNEQFWGPNRCVQAVMVRGKLFVILDFRNNIQMIYIHIRVLRGSGWANIDNHGLSILDSASL